MNEKFFSFDVCRALFYYIFEHRKETDTLRIYETKEEARRAKNTVKDRYDSKIYTHTRDTRKTQEVAEIGEWTVCCQLSS